MLHHRKFTNLNPSHAHKSSKSERHEHSLDDTRGFLPVPSNFLPPPPFPIIVPMNQFSPVSPLPPFVRFVQVQQQIPISPFPPFAQVVPSLPPLPSALPPPVPVVMTVPVDNIAHQNGVTFYAQNGQTTRVLVEMFVILPNCERWRVYPDGRVPIRVWEIDKLKFENGSPLIKIQGAWTRVAMPVIVFMNHKYLELHPNGSFKQF